MLLCIYKEGVRFIIRQLHYPGNSIVLLEVNLDYLYCKYIANSRATTSFFLSVITVTLRKERKYNHIK